MQQGDPQAQAAKRLELAKASFEAALRNMRELAEVAGRSNREALEVINQRALESFEEIKKAMDEREAAPEAGRRRRQVVTIAFDDFLKVDVRVGTVLSAAPTPAARKPAYVLEVDFGPALGRKNTSAQLTELYAPEQLVGRQVAAVVNFPPKRIAQPCPRSWCSAFPTPRATCVCSASTTRCRTARGCSSARGR